MKLNARPGVGGISLMGVEYVCDSQGEIDVPDHLAPIAVAAGFDYVAPDGDHAAIEQPTDAHAE